MKAASTLAVNGAKTMGRRASFDASNCMQSLNKRRGSVSVDAVAIVAPPVRRSSFTYAKATFQHEHKEIQQFPLQHHQMVEYYKSSLLLNAPLSKEKIFKILEQEPKPSVAAKTLPCEMVFLGGAPGAGKGTNSEHIASVRGHAAKPIVVSSLLDTPECRRLKDEGKMVDDAFVFDLLMKEAQKPEYRNGVVVDGFPRTAKQAKFLTDMHQDMVANSETPPQFMFVMLHVGENASIERQLSRGEFIKQQNAQRAQEGLGALELRVTDSSYESAKARYTIFEQQLSAVMDLGKKFTSVIIDASSTIENVRNLITNQMSTLPKLI